MSHTSIDPKKLKKLQQESAQEIMLHLGLTRLGATRLMKVLTREAHVVEVKPLKGKKRVPPKGPLSIDELRFLDDEFKRVATDAMAARVRLHQLVTLKRLTEEDND